MEQLIDITIKGVTQAQVNAVFAALNGSVSAPAIAAATAPASPVANSDDDENHDVDAAPGTLDANGLPWDERIHSTPAKTTAKGVWRKRKGADDATIAAVEAELRARQAGSAQQTTTPIPQPQTIPAPVVQQQPIAQPQTIPAPVAQPVQQPIPAPTGETTTIPAPVAQPIQQQPIAQPVQAAPVATAAPQPGAIDFNGFMQHMAGLIQAGRADQHYMGSVVDRIKSGFASVGQTVELTAITDIAGKQNLIDYAIQIMASDGRW